MALTPLPEYNTERWWLEYSDQGAAHKMLMRTDGPRDASEVAEAFATFMAAIVDGVNVLTITGLTHAAEGSNITNPESTTGLAGSYGTASGDPINIPLEMTFPGRSRDGRKTYVSLYGWAAQTDETWRYLATESSIVLDGITALNGLSAGGLFVSISGQRVFRNAYANVSFNDYWVGKRRRGA